MELQQEDTDANLLDETARPGIRVHGIVELRPGKVIRELVEELRSIWVARMFWVNCDIVLGCHHWSPGVIG